MMRILNSLEVRYIAPTVFTSCFHFAVYAYEAPHLSLCFCSPQLPSQTFICSMM